MNFRRELSLQQNYNYIIGVDEAGRGPLAGPVVAAAFCFVTSQDSFLDNWPWSHIADSKAINEVQREELYDRISAKDDNTPPWYFYAHSTASPQEIDDQNILNATLLAMSRATYKVVRNILEQCPEESENKLNIKVLVDGNRVPPITLNSIPQNEETVIPNILTPPRGLTEETKTWWNDCIQTRINPLICETIVKGDSSVVSIAAASIVAKVVRDRIMRDLDKAYPKYNLAIHKGYPTPEHKKLVRSFGPSFIHRLSFEPCLSLVLDKSFEIPEGRCIENIIARQAAKKKKRSRCQADMNNQMVLKSRSEESYRKIIKK